MLKWLTHSFKPAGTSTAHNVTPPPAAATLSSTKRKRRDSSDIDDDDSLAKSVPRIPDANKEKDALSDTDDTSSAATDGIQHPTINQQRLLPTANSCTTQCGQDGHTPAQFFASSRFSDLVKTHLRLPEFRTAAATGRHRPANADRPAPVDDDDARLVYDAVAVCLVHLGGDLGGALLGAAGQDSRIAICLATLPFSMELCQRAGYVQHMPPNCHRGPTRILAHDLLMKDTSGTNPTTTNSATNSVSPLERYLQAERLQLSGENSLPTWLLDHFLTLKESTAKHRRGDVTAELFSADYLAGLAWLLKRALDCSGSDDTHQLVYDLQLALQRTMKYEHALFEDGLHQYTAAASTTSSALPTPVQFFTSRKFQKLLQEPFATQSSFYSVASSGPGAMAMNPSGLIALDAIATAFLEGNNGEVDVAAVPSADAHPLEERLASLPCTVQSCVEAGFASPVTVTTTTTTMKLPDWLLHHLRDVEAIHVKEPDERTPAEAEYVTDGDKLLSLLWLLRRFPDQFKRRVNDECRCLSALIDFNRTAIARSTAHFEDGIAAQIESGGADLVSVQRIVKNGGNVERTLRNEYGIKDADVVKVLVLGNSGKGKSFLINNLCGSKVFDSEYQCEGVTNTVNAALLTTNSSEQSGQKYVLYDVPGLIEANANRTDSNAKMITEAIHQFPRAKTAVVLVFSPNSGGRVDAADIECYTSLKKFMKFVDVDVQVVVNQVPRTFSNQDARTTFLMKTEASIKALIGSNARFPIFVDKLSDFQSSRLSPTTGKIFANAVAKACEHATIIKPSGESQIRLANDELQRALDRVQKSADAYEREGRENEALRREREAELKDELKAQRNEVCNLKDRLRKAKKSSCDVM